MNCRFDHGWQRCNAKAKRCLFQYWGIIRLQQVQAESHGSIWIALILLDLKHVDNSADGNAMQRGTVLETYRGSMNFGPCQCLRLWKETRKVCSQVGSPRVFWPNKCGCKALQWNQEQCQSRVLICGRMGWANARQVPEYQQSKPMQIPSLPALGLKPKGRTLQGVAITTLIIIDMARLHHVTYFTATTSLGTKICECKTL
jgi:hypothetical protein